MPNPFPSEVISEEEEELMQNPEIMDMLIWCVIDFLQRGYQFSWLSQACRLAESANREDLLLTWE